MTLNLFWGGKQTMVRRSGEGTGIWSRSVIWLGYFVLGIYSLMGSPAQAESPVDWNQWRGPQRDGTYRGPAWPAGIDETRLRELWRVKLGPSYSGPIVVGDRVFTTETRDKLYEVVSAWNRETGKKIWETQWEGSLSVPFFAKSNGDWIRSTPAYDNGRLYVAGMRDVLVCLDAASGQQVWRRDFADELKTPVPAFGFVCSPLVIGDAVFVQAAASFMKLDKNTGEVIWKTLEDGGGMFGSAFASPFLANVAGKEQLLVQTREKLAGVALDTGAVLWEQTVPAFRGMNILTPTIFEDGVFTSSYGGKSTLYRVNSGSDGWEVKEEWTNKTQGYMSSPLIIDGHAYLHLRNQRFCCINLATGKETWITEPFGKYWSLVAQGDRLLALDERGELLMIRANPEKFELLESRKLGSDETWAHLAVTPGRLYVRELGALTVYAWEEP